MLTLQLIDIDYRKIKRQKCLFRILLSSTFLLIIVNRILDNYLRDLHLNDLYIAVIYLFFLIPYITCLVLYIKTRYEKNFSPSGELYIDSSHIEILRITDKKSLVIDDIEHIKFVYNSIDDLYLPSIKNQINQFWIEIKMDRAFYILDYIVKDKNQLKLLIVLLKSFSQRKNVQIFNLARLSGYGMNKVPNYLKKEYKELYFNKLDRLKTTSANTRYS